MKEFPTQFMKGEIEIYGGQKEADIKESKNRNWNRILNIFQKLQL